MTKETKCDTCPARINSDQAYAIDIYSIGNKTHLKVDQCHTCVMASIISKIGTEVLKWKRWSVEEKRFVDAK